MLLVLAPLSYTSIAVANETPHFTDSAGKIIGTPPEVINANHEHGKINITKESTRDASQQLDVGDTLNLSWEFLDNEGDADATVLSTLWTCINPQTGQRMLAAGKKHYTITQADIGCSISVSMIPVTVTGIPRNNTELFIEDVSSYDPTDNILDGPVNPHAISITDYIVAPGTSQSETVSPETMLHTGWEGGKVQIETDNIASQVTWKSSDENIASVSSTGLVTFKSKGDVTISASNNYDVTGTIRFDPDLFYIFSTKTMNWADAKAWCANQGYTMPAINQLSTATNTRTIPASSLWQEWGDVSQQGIIEAGIVYWSTTKNASTQYQYMYINDGHISSNNPTAYEGVACLAP